MRHHLLSLLVAGLALLLGLGLGAGPVAEDTADGQARETRRLQDRIAALEGALGSLRDGRDRDAKALAAMAAPLTAESLSDRSVLVVASPGARDADVRRVRTALEGAGATVTGVLALRGTYVDPARAESPLEDLSLRLVPPGVEFPDGSLPIERVGTVLARSTVQEPDEDEPASEEVDQDAAEVIAGLDELDALRLDGDPGVRAELAVLVAGPRDAAEAETALTGLLVALDRGSSGAVLTAPGDARSGPLRWVRDDAGRELDEVSTVDSLASPVGTTGLVLALAEQVTGGSGDYGLGLAAGRVLPGTGAHG